jgi:hypothetical protein
VCQSDEGFCAEGLECFGGKSLLDIFDEALQRKQSLGGWKRWNWPITRDSFDTEAELSKHIKMDAAADPLTQNPVWKEEDLKRRADGLRQRMRDLWIEVQQDLHAHHERMCGGAIKSTAIRKLHRRARMTSDEITAETAEFHLDMVVKMMSQLCTLDGYIYQMIAAPIASYLEAKVPPDTPRDSCKFPVRRSPAQLAPALQLGLAQLSIKCLVACLQTYCAHAESGHGARTGRGSF